MRGACVLFAFPSFSPSFFFSRVPPSPFFRFYSLSFRLVYRSPLVSFLLPFSGTHWGGSRAALTRWGLLRIIARSNRPNGSLVPLYRSIPGCPPSTGPCWVWKQTGYPGPGATDDGRGAAARCRCSLYMYIGRFDVLTGRSHAADSPPPLFPFAFIAGFPSLRDECLSIPRIVRLSRRFCVPRIRTPFVRRFASSLIFSGVAYKWVLTSAKERINRK